MFVAARCAAMHQSARPAWGPSVDVITVGVLFLLQQMRGGYFDFGNTYPVILVVIGAILLASSLAPMEGHISSTCLLHHARGCHPAARRRTRRTDAASIRIPGKDNNRTWPNGRPRGSSIFSGLDSHHHRRAAAAPQLSRL